MAQLVENLLSMWKMWIRSLDWEDPWRREQLPTPLFWVAKSWTWLNYFHLDFPDSSVGKESACSAGDPGLIPGARRSTGEGIGYPLQYFLASLVAQLVKNPPAVQETWVGSLGWEDPLEKGKATHSCILAWKNPWGCKESEITEWLSLSGFIILILQIGLFCNLKKLWDFYGVHNNQRRQAKMQIFIKGKGEPETFGINLVAYESW